MKTNVRPKTHPPIITHEGAPAARIGALARLRRSVLATLLWEDQFYEDGASIADRIRQNAAACTREEVAKLAVEARRAHGLRHAPLLLLLDLIKRGGAQTANTIANTVMRVDEMAELVNLYWADPNNKRMLPRQMKRGLATALRRFDEYQLAKYDREGAVRLRDVLFLIHARPDDEEQAALFKRVAERSLAIPDTWEVALSTGGDKKETFTRLLTEGKLGYLALLRNLRNMVQAGVDERLIMDAILGGNANNIFPFRFTAAARAVPQLEAALDKKLIASIVGSQSLPGRTIVLVDVSGSMEASLSGKSDLTRMDAAATLASVINAESLRVFSFSADVIEVPARRGMAGVDAVIRSQTHSVTYLDEAVRLVNALPHDRLIVITDEQAAGPVRTPLAKDAYMINVASYQNGIGYRGGWKHIDGFSEAVIRYIAAIESEAQEV